MRKDGEWGMGILGSRYQRRGLVLVVALVSLALSGVGYASSGAQTQSTSSTATVAKQTSEHAQYGNKGPVKPATDVKGASYKPPTTAAKSVAASGALPFTGISLVGFLALGAGLVGVGIAVFRRGESRE
jgi:hypothetical protein